MTITFYVVTWPDGRITASDSDHYHRALSNWQAYSARPSQTTERMAEALGGSCADVFKALQQTRVVEAETATARPSGSRSNRHEL